MAEGGFFLIFNIEGVYKYTDGDYHGTKVKPRIFDNYEEAYHACMTWGGIRLSDYEKSKSSRFIARVGEKVCAEFVDKEGRRIVWSDHPGFPATAGYGESAMRIK
jgi:hypothetical protein